MDNPIRESYVYEEGVRRGRGARFYHPHTNTFGTSGHVKYHPESLYDLNLSKYDATARTQEAGCVENHQCLVDKTHFNDEDKLYYVTKKVYVGWSPVVQVILVSRAPIMNGGPVAKRYE